MQGYAYLVRSMAPGQAPPPVPTHYSTELVSDTTIDAFLIATPTGLHWDTMA